MLNDKIKALRKMNNMTQEELADKLYVSRQAITKWESGLGTPDISNIEAIAKLFNLSIDELLSNDLNINKDNVSRTEFDIFNKKSFNLKVGTINKLDVTTSDIEKVIVEVRTDLSIEAYKIIKIKLDEEKDINLVAKDNKNIDISKQDARDHIFIKMILPNKLTNDIELEGNINELNIHDMLEDRLIEFDGRANNIILSNLRGHLEINCNIDLNIDYDGSLRQLDINQLKSISNLYLTKDVDLNIYNKGRASNIIFKDFINNDKANNKIELNGYKSELTINRK